MRLFPLSLAVLLTALAPTAFAGEKKESPERRSSRPNRNLKIPDHLSPQGRKLLEQAISLYEKALDATSDQERLFKKAEKTLVKATKNIEIRDYALPHYYLGSAYMHTKNFEKAQPSLEKAIELNPRFHEARLQLAEVLAAKGEFKKALEHHDKTLSCVGLDNASGKKSKRKLSPDEIDTRALKGKFDALVRLEKPRQALRFAKKVIKSLKKPRKSPGPYLKGSMLYLERALKKRSWKHVVETKNYKVASNLDREFAEEVAHRAELIRKAYMQVFPKIDRPDRKYEIWLYKDRDAYHKDGGPRMAGGHYSPVFRRLALFKYRNKEETFVTLQHEAFHQYLHEYLGMAPQWFNEGLGDYFGPFQYVRDGNREIMRSHPNTGRVKAVQYAIKADKLPPLRDLMLMSREEMYGRDAGFHYAQAWSLIYFMIEARTYMPILLKYWRELRKGRGINVAYQSSFAKINMARFEKQWKSFTLKIDPPRGSRADRER